MLRSFPVLALPLLLVACARSEQRPPHVVLILVDQLRADAVEPCMPETFALAQQGVVLTEMRSAAPWTYPSVVSLLSGLYPHQHGADASPAGDELSHISPEVPLLPRTLRNHGYHAAAFVTNPFLHAWNTAFQGSFDHCDASFIGDQGARRGHPELVWTERMFANTVNAHVREFYDARPLEEPEFTYVHYIDVHGRKEGPEQWKDAPFEPGYQNAARYVDQRIVELYRYFHARYAGDLLFVVTSDHGQNLGDDLMVGEGRPWRWRKASLHDFNLRIPFLVLPGNAVPRVTVDLPCSNVDVAPTLLAWLGLEDQPGAAGISLLPVLHGGSGDPLRPLYARNSTNQRLEEALLVGTRKTVRYERLFVGGEEFRRSACFDLASDPREVRPEACGSLELEALTRAVEAAGRIYPATFAAPSEDTRQKLEELGYGGPSGTDDG